MINGHSEFTHLALAVGTADVLRRFPAMQGATGSTVSRLVRPIPSRVVGDSCVDSSLDHGEHCHDHQDRHADEEDLVPSALVGENRTDRRHRLTLRPGRPAEERQRASDQQRPA